MNIFTGSNQPVVTAFTSAVNLTVIHRHHRQPRTAHVATFALIGRINVSRILARGKVAIVTSDTSLLHHHRMIEYWHQPGRGHVTSTAHQGRGNMIRRLPRGTHPVMAVRTRRIADDAVIHGDRSGKAHSSVANIAGGANRDMRR